MTDPGRRRVLKLGLAALAAPGADALAVGNEGRWTAGQYAHGGLKGFVIGDVRNQEDSFFDALAATGANIARVFFHYPTLKGWDHYGRSPNTVAAMARMLDQARARKLGLVIVGGFEGVDRFEFWADAGRRQSVIENWRWFARTFGNDSAIAGLDLLNEPNPPSASGSAAEANSHWRPFAEQIIKAIRDEGVRAPVIFEAAFGAASAAFRDFQPLKDPEVVYSLHQYSPHEITHQHVEPGCPRTIPYPAGAEWKLGGWDPAVGVTAYDRQRLETDLRDAIAFQARHQVPMFVGEFSCVRWAPAGSRERYVADTLAIFRKFGWSWCYHEFRGWTGWDAEIASEERAVTTRTANAPLMRLLRTEISSNAGTSASE